MQNWNFNREVVHNKWIINKNLYNKENMPLKRTKEVQWMFENTSELFTT